MAVIQCQFPQSQMGSEIQCRRVLSVTNVPKYYRSKYAKCPKIVKTVVVVKSDTRNTSRQIVDMVEISKASALRFCVKF